MRTFAGLMMAGALVAGCGGGDKTYSAAGLSVAVADRAYYSFPDVSVCRAGGVGQLKIEYVDYNYICDPTQPPQRDGNSEHVTLQLIVTIGLPPDYAQHYPTMGPYEVGPGNCVEGPTSPVIAQFLHYPAKGGLTPDRIVQADSGELVITDFDATQVKPLKGHFDLKFGADEIKDSFSLDSCTRP